MNEYEIVIERINPCGGSSHGIREIIEAEAQSPEAYLEKNARFPITERIEQGDGSVLIITGNGRGYFDRYTFTEI